MAGGGGSQQSARIDPTIQPYVEYGLGEARRLYEQGAPSYFPGQTYVGPGQYTQQAMDLAAQRATQGSPLQRAALGQQQATVEGQYLGGNPFFQGAFQSATRGAEQSYLDAIARTRSQASSLGRTGSGAMGEQEGRAESALARSLSDTAGSLAYQNYAAERGRQEAAAAAAPQLAASEYGDIQRLANVGAMGEDYAQRALAADIQRYNYGQQAPFAQLQSFLSGVYGAPSGMISSQPLYGNPILGGLGGAALGYGLGAPSGYGGYGAAVGGLLGAYGARA